MRKMDRIPKKNEWFETMSRLAINYSSILNNETCRQVHKTRKCIGGQQHMKRKKKTGGLKFSAWRVVAESSSESTRGNVLKDGKMENYSMPKERNEIIEQILTKLVVCVITEDKKEVVNRSNANNKNRIAQQQKITSRMGAVWYQISMSTNQMEKKHVLRAQWARKWDLPVELLCQRPWTGRDSVEIFDQSNADKCLSGKWHALHHNTELSRGEHSKTLS